MSVDLVTVAIGILVTVGASVAAVYLKRRMDASTGIEVVGWAMTLMVANVMQLVGVVVVLAGFFG
jgi:hypothetical protein